jgi:hypothetical protein
LGRLGVSARSHRSNAVVNWPEHLDEVLAERSASNARCQVKVGFIYAPIDVCWASDGAKDSR